MFSLSGPGPIREIDPTRERDSPEGQVGMGEVLAER